MCTQTKAAAAGSKKTKKAAVPDVKEAKEKEKKSKKNKKEHKSKHKGKDKDRRKRTQGKAKKSKRCRSSSSASSSSCSEGTSQSRSRCAPAGVVTIEDSSPSAPASPEPGGCQGSTGLFLGRAVRGSGKQVPEQQPSVVEVKPSDAVAGHAAVASSSAQTMVSASHRVPAVKVPRAPTKSDDAPPPPASPVGETEPQAARKLEPEVVNTPQDEETSAATGALDSNRRLLESALYREDVLDNGHACVWGSWYDTASKRWGFACCRGLERGASCSGPLGAASASSKTKRQPAYSRSGSAIEGADDASLFGRISELPPRDAFKEPQIYIVHWIRAVLGEWTAQLREGKAPVVGNPRFGSFSLQEEAEKAVRPLLRILEAASSEFWKGESVDVWSVGNNKWMKDGKVVDVLAAETLISGSRTAADGNMLPKGSILVCFSGGEARKWVVPSQFDSMLRKSQPVELAQEAINKLDRMVVLAAARDYHAANQTYIELTVGHGRWHEDLSVKGLTGCNKAPRGGFKVKKDQQSFLETEEAKEYMFCMKRLLAFLQLVCPNEDVSKHFT